MKTNEQIFESACYKRMHSFDLTRFHMDYTSLFEAIMLAMDYVKQAVQKEYTKNPLHVVHHNPDYDFREAVKNMMALQQRYFKGDKSVLSDCKAIESKVRGMLDVQQERLL